MKGLTGEVNGKFFFKGKRVTEKNYNKRCKQKKFAKNIRSIFASKTVSNLKEELKDVTKFTEIEGRRIVHLETLAKQLFCQKCKSVLSLTNIIKEIRCGLASKFSVQCSLCKVVTEVVTDKQHDVINNQNKHFDTNTKAVMGTINGGMGNTHLNSVLLSLNIPLFNWNTFKTHEKEVGKVMEEMAQESCKVSALEERTLTIENAEEITKLLPIHLTNDFIFPDSCHALPNISVALHERVRIAASFDMGWITRGTGRTYDSLSGTAALVGFFSKKVISYVTLNRKCKMCDNGHSTSDHDCRLNFEGSAKAMEPRAAVQLTTNNAILTEANLQVGIIIADNDSSSISAVRHATEHEVVKQADKNHTSKGVVNELYKIQKNYKELTGVTIKYLQRCFNHCVAQNKGDSGNMAKAIKNIPHHCFNDHKNCGAWCNFSKNPDNYKHSNIGDGFKDKNLFTALKILFDKLAENTNKFSSGVSSNVNESLNTMIVSKAPKSRMYGMSPSGDIRVASAIIKKNNGEKYLSDLAKKLNMSPGTHTKHYTYRASEKSKKRYLKSLQPSFKRRRLLLKKNKTELRNKKECREGTTYATDCGLLERLPVSLPLAVIDEKLQPIVVLFDLETGGFLKTADILQVAAKYKHSEFSIYVKPTQNIKEEASAVNGLRYIDGNLYLHDKLVLTISLTDAMQALYEFLFRFRRKCILTAHNCKFDYPRLMRAIKNVGMSEHFKSLIEGFSDTLPIIVQCTGKKGKGKNKLEVLADNLKLKTDGMHDALIDVIMLQQVLDKLKIPNEKIIKSTLHWDEIEKKESLGNKLSGALQELSPLNQCVSYAMRKKMVAANVSFEIIKTAFQQNGFTGLNNILGKDENDNVRVTKCRTVIKKIYDFLRST